MSDTPSATGAPSRNVSSLFTPAPAQWGLRGDAALWLAMRELFARQPMPATATELDALVVKAFQALCGRPIRADQSFRLRRFGEAGISPQFWRERALPLLKSRWERAQSPEG